MLLSNTVSPIESISNFLSYLDRGDMQRARQVCSLWNIAALIPAVEKEHEVLCLFTKSISENLSDKYQDQKRELLQLSFEKQFFDLTNFTQLGISFCKSIDKIANVLEKMHFGDFLEFRKKQPAELQSLHLLVQLELARKRFDVNHHDFIHMSYSFCRISIEFAKMGCFDKAIEIIKSIDEESERGSACRKIVEILLKSNNVKKIVEVMSFMPSEYDITFYHVISELIKSGHEKIADEVSKFMHESIRDSVLESVKGSFDMRNCIEDEISNEQFSEDDSI